MEAIAGAEHTAHPEKQPLCRSNIVWETPNTPISADDYLFLDGKRLVRPYFFEFIAHVKKRWDKKVIVDLFANEFRQRPIEYYIEAVNSGRICVNGKTVTSKYVVGASQTLSHYVHRHEPPVMADPVAILEMGPDVITVCKPPSVPVHPCGQYRKNTVVGILQAEHDLGPLYPVHRLDRLVSGLLIFARNAHTADRFRQEIEAGEVQKQYVARVKGVFPAEKLELNVPIIYDAREGRSAVQVTDPADITGRSTETNKLEGQELNAKLQNKHLVSLQLQMGKRACTRFQRLSTNGVHSVVQCMPLTGRTHQIRVHLQHLGHPIANDALYADDNPPSRYEKGTNAERAARAGQCREMASTGECGTSPAMTQCKRQRFSDATTGSSECLWEQSAMPKAQTSDHPHVTNKFSGREEIENCDQLAIGSTYLPPTLSSVDCESKTLKFEVDEMCTHCPNLAPSGYQGAEHGLWLHCVHYSGKGWDYACSLPNWANLETPLMC